MSDDVLLIDELCPRSNFTRIEHLAVEVDTARAMEALRSLDLATVRSPLTDLAMSVRTLPERVGHSQAPPPASLRLGDLFDEPAEMSAMPGWVGLAERRGQQLVFGAVGMFWRPKIVWNTVAAEDFAAFGEPGWGKIAASVTGHPYGQNRSILTYEARTVLTDDVSRRRFGRYWTVVSPFVGVIMRAALSAVADSVSDRAG